MTSQGVDGTVDKAGRILPDSNQRVKECIKQNVSHVWSPSGYLH